MSETTELNIVLSAKGGDAAASDIKKPAVAIDDLKKGHKELKTQFSERFSAVALDMYAKDALRAAGYTGEMRKVMSMLDFATVALGNSFGFLTSKMGLYLTAGAAIIGILSKFKGASDDVKRSLEEQLKAQISSGEEARKSVEQFNSMNHIVADKLTPAMREYEESIRRVNAAQNTSAIETTNKLILEMANQIKELKDQSAGYASALSNENTESLQRNKNLEDQGVQVSKVASNTKFYSTAIAENKKRVDDLNEALIQQKGNLEALRAGYSSALEYRKSMDDMAKKSSDDALEAEKKQMAEDEKTIAAELKAYQKAEDMKKKLDDDCANHYKALQKKRFSEERENVNASIAMYQEKTSRGQALDEEESEQYKSLLKQREDNYKATVNNIATLAYSGNKTLSAIGKAAALSSAYIDTYAAANKALNSAPPPLSYALAAATVAAGLANVAKIMGVQGFATGTDQMFGKPTLIQVGENGMERVTVTPVGAGGRPVSQQWQTTNNRSSVSIGAIHLHSEGTGGNSEDRMFKRLIYRIRGMGDLSMVRG